MLAAGSLANDAVLREDGGVWTIQGDPTEAAFLVAEAKIEGLHESPGGALRARRRGAVHLRAEADEYASSPTLAGELGLAVVTKGAPDVLLARCTQERLRAGLRPLTGTRRSEILAIVERLADLALRTLAVAYRPLPPDERPPEDESVERELVYLGLVGIIDPPRPEARTAIAEAHAAGVRVLMITGDHPHTAARIAADLGIAAAGSRVVTGGELEALDDDARAAAVREVSVYARVAPEHKLRIVDALQADGRIVAMTGDGVNDAPALKAADIGVAMGVAGTDVAKEAADMILADDNFATIVERHPRGARDLREHPQVPALPALVEHRRGLHDVLRRRARRRASGWRTPARRSRCRCSRRRSSGSTSSPTARRRSRSAWTRLPTTSCGGCRAG